MGKNDHETPEETAVIVVESNLEKVNKRTLNDTTKTLLDTDLGVQEVKLRKDIEEAKLRREIVRTAITTFAIQYNDKFHNEIKEVSVLKAEHSSLLQQVNDKESLGFTDAFFGMGGMDGSWFNAEAPDQKFENLSTEEKEEIKDLYKFLAKKLHPNAHPGATEEEKKGYDQLFKLMRDAYDDGNIEGLRILAKGFDWEALKTAENKDEIVKPEINILDALRRLLHDIKTETHNLTYTDAYKNFLKSKEEKEKWRNEEKVRFTRDIDGLKEQIGVLEEILAGSKTDG